MPQKEGYQVQCPAIDPKFAAVWTFADHNISCHFEWWIRHLSVWQYIQLPGRLLLQEVLLLCTLKGYMPSALAVLIDLRSAYSTLTNFTQAINWPVGLGRHGPCTFPLLNLVETYQNLTCGLLY